MNYHDFYKQADLHPAMKATAPFPFAFLPEWGADTPYTTESDVSDKVTLPPTDDNVQPEQKSETSETPPSPKTQSAAPTSKKPGSTTPSKKQESTPPPKEPTWSDPVSGIQGYQNHLPALALLAGAGALGGWALSGKDKGGAGALYGGLSLPALYLAYLFGRRNNWIGGAKANGFDTFMQNYVNNPVNGLFTGTASKKTT